MRSLVLMACLTLVSPVHAADSSIAEFICNGVTDRGERKECLEKAATATRHSVAQRSSEATPPWFSFIWPVGWWVVYYAFGLIVARYIYRDANKREWIFLGLRPIWWAVLTFFDPAMGIIAYWAAHYSKMAQSYVEAMAPPTARSDET